MMLFDLAFLDWKILATFSGAVGLTVILVQWLKLPLDKVWHIPTRYLVYVVCLSIMVLGQVFTGVTLSLEIIALTMLNAVLGTFAAMSLYERAIEAPEWESTKDLRYYMETGQLPEGVADIVMNMNGQAKADREGESAKEEPPDQP